MSTGGSGLQKRLKAAPVADSEFPLEHQLTYALIFVAIGGALGGLGWTAMWLYAPDHKADPGKLGTIGASFGVLAGALFILWLDLAHWLAAMATAVIVGGVIAGVWRRLTRN